MSLDDEVPQADQDIAYDYLNCMDQGKCGVFTPLPDRDVKVDLWEQIPLENAVRYTDPTTGDFILKGVRILSPGIRNGYHYERDVVAATRHYKGLLELQSSSSPFMVPHSSNPLEQIGRFDNMQWNPTADSIVGDMRVYNDDDLPAAKAAIALMKRETGFLSVSTRLKAEPVIEEGKTSVKNLRLIHVAWVDVGADPKAGVSMSNIDNSEETLDNLLPTSDKDSWDGGGAKRRVWEWSGQNANKAKAAYFWAADNPQKQGDLKLPFADIVNGTLTAIKGGVQAAFGAMRGSHGNKPSIPSGDMSGVMAKIHSYYTKMGLEWPLDTGEESQSEDMDTTQTDNETAKDTETNERSSTMATEEELVNAEASKESCAEFCKDEGTPAEEEAEQQANIPVVDNAVVLTMTQEEFDLKLDEALKEHDEMMAEAYRRKDLIGEIMKLDQEAKQDFLVTLSEEQLREHKATIERFAQAMQNVAQKNTELARQYPAFEKPQYGGMAATYGVDMAEVEKIYPPKSAQQMRAEQAKAFMTQRLVKGGDA